MMRTSMAAAALAAAAHFAAPQIAAAAEHTIFFDLGSSRLDAEARATLQRAAEDYRRTGSAAVSLVGHTDTTGGRDFNLRLSQRRAEAAAQALMAGGVPMEAMTLGWRGEDDLAVPTGDNVAERRNRRVEISLGAPPAEPAPMVPQTMDEFVGALRFGIGPYVGFSNQHRDNSTYLGANLTATYDLTELLSVSAQQAVFYNVGADDGGLGSRTAIGGHVRAGDMGGFEPFVGVIGGRYWIDGSGRGGWFAGPEVGVRVGDFEIRAAYDAVEPRGWDKGVISLSAGYVLRF